jgi:type VI secretion system VgrG family protein
MEMKMTRSRLLILLICALPALPVSAEVVVPNIFVGGQKAVAADVNENFRTSVQGINSNTTEINSMKFDITSINERLGGEASGIPGPAGPPGPPGVGAGNSSQLSSVGAMLMESELASHFPASALDGQTCSTKSPITASATVGGLSMAVTGMLGSEAISKTYKFSFIGTTPSKVDTTALIGSPASLNISTAAGSRTFSGITTRIGKSYNAAGDAVYIVTIEPALSRLGMANDYKIYQELSSADVIQEIFNNYGLSVSMSLSASYPPRDMMVMYDQSPLSYIQRLSEEEGMAYYFSGGDAVFIDDASAYASSALSLSFSGVDYPASQDFAYALSYFDAGSLTASQFTAAGSNFETPDTSLLSSQGSGTSEKYSFDYKHKTTFDTLSAALTDLSRESAASVQHNGTSNSPAISPGHAFSLNATGSAATLSGSYVATAVNHALAKSADGSCLIYANSFSSMPASIFARPALSAEKRKVDGSLTATVTGPFGEKRYTDQYGRIKVQFHWDRDGGSNENSSAWIRVATPVNRLADKHLYIPEIGSEVLVSFLNGDPAQPIVTGSLYNANNMPPLELPLNVDAADNNAFNDYYYYTYTLAGQDGTTTQSIFATKKTSVSLAKDGSCSFTTDESYALTQSASSSSSTIINHKTSRSTGKYIPVCGGFTLGSNTLDLIVDGRLVELKMDPDWDNGFAIQLPASDSTALKQITFIYIVKKSSAPLSDLPY